MPDAPASPARTLTAQPLTAEAFAPYGDVLDCSGAPDKMINAGLCGRYHDRARLEFGAEGRAGINLFQAEPRSLPYSFDLVEHHPDGSQAFLPMSQHPFLVIVAPPQTDAEPPAPGAPPAEPAPGAPLAFLTQPGQGINFARGTWHGVLTPLAAPGLFAVVDRIGPGPNLVEYTYAHPWTVRAP